MESEEKDNIYNWEAAKTTPLATKKGAKKKFRTPADLWAVACDFFTWVESRPIKTADFIRSGDHAGKTVTIMRPRPFTWANFESYLWIHGICAHLDHYRVNTGGAYTEYGPVIKAINAVMYSQKFDQAAVGIYNANLVARELGMGLSDKFKDKENDEDLKAPQVNIYMGDLPPLARSEKDIDLTRKPTEQ